ncbi:MAG: bifunctional phosphopantothenoylcysteine decarboxylase/phosphopantothenate--cysteine ligase CoaBC [Prevotellaceae bacterium]|jgi:phosphopantothenoylcysteine decarboxylase/phosphopantothenate--cysteine ligase|nr:bifunctional phosphopantothenoylcysteine decarboxylase/phosphopantothenate--cysteine ligase CoaBC [Prevotellaceae bacterium]
MLKGKHILVGVSGGIAAYKAAALVRALVKDGAEVRVVMTPMAKHFITSLTMATVSKHPVLAEFYNPENGDWNNHVSLSLWADAYVVAPATANTLAKMAHGIADNLLLTTYLSMRCPVIAAPAMDMDMWNHPATQNNLQTLQKRGVHIIEPPAGELASGLEGKGRMEEPERIAAFIEQLFVKKKSLAGKTVLVTAGPTYEAIDPVRFIGNHSSGKMGYALAESLANCGAQVLLISGPTSLPVPKGVELVRVTAAAEMHAAVTEHFASVDVAIFCAAVADYTPEKKSTHKIKREKEPLLIALKPTVDIAAAVGKQKRKNQLTVGFALETGDELTNAQKKLQTKNLDMIVLNSLNDEGMGFGSDTNKITIIKKDGAIATCPLLPKQKVAEIIIDAVVDAMMC